MYWYSKELAPAVCTHGHGPGGAKRAAEAVAILDRAGALAPGNAALWTQLGVAREATGDRARALQAVERALALDPSDALARSTLASMRAR